MVQVAVLVSIQCLVPHLASYFLVELVTKVKTSWFSSSSNMVPRYPKRLSAKRGEASNFRHSICPKCVLSPNVKRYNSLATLFLLLECECMSFLSRGLNTPHVGIVALFPKAGANSSALLLHHSSLVGNRFRSSHIPNELLHCVVLVYTCMASVAILAYTKSLWWPLGPHRGGGRNVKQVRARESWRCRDARVGRLLEPNALAIWYGTAAG
jgi:hypothetical protein